MNLKKQLLLSLSLCGFLVNAQHSHKIPEGTPKNFFYATMDANQADKLKVLHPTDVKIISVKDNEAVVNMSNYAAADLHQFVLSHGPGYILHSGEKDAKNYLQRPAAKNLSVLDFSISEDELVKTLIDQVDEQNLENVIKDLEAINSRFHRSSTNNVGMHYIKDLWQSLIDESGRTDLKVEFVTHMGTPQLSIIFTIEGNEEAEEYIIIGGHADSIVNANWGGQFELRSPGADDNASGIATITEALRILIENDYKPKKTIQIMAYAAEEVGLVGSNEIASKYRDENKDVKAYVQFDMTNFKGSKEDVYITTDSYNSNDLNLFLVELMEHYNATGDHAFTYDYTVCNYGCSDHAAWGNRGYPSAFPFEASFNDSNPNIHTSNDTYSKSNESSAHAAKFAKLALQFLVEATKPTDDLGLNNTSKSNSKIVVNQKTLNYFLESSMNNNRVKIINPTGQIVYQNDKLSSNGQLNLTQLTNGMYIVVFESDKGVKFTSKFLIH